MNKFARILVPVDGSQGSDRALDVAVAMADACGASLDLLYVSYFGSDTDGTEDMDSWLPDIVVAPAGSESKAVLKRARDRVPRGMEARLHHRIGKPAEQIVEFSRENEEETIVIGGSSQDAVHRFFLGSISQEVMESAPGAVIVVK